MNISDAGASRLGSHSSMMEPMLAEFEQIATEVTYAKPLIPLCSNLTGQLATDEIATPTYWCRHVRQPVRFAASMETLSQQNYKIFVEIGPKPSLLGMGSLCLSEGTWLASLRQGQEDWQQLLQSLGELYVHGVPIDWSGFDKDYPRRRLQLPTYPFERQRYWIDTPQQKISALAGKKSGIADSDVQNQVERHKHPEIQGLLEVSENANPSKPIYPRPSL